MATSSHRSAFNLKSSQNQALFSLFDVIVCGDDAQVKRGKPFPDLFLHAFQQLNLKSRTEAEEGKGINENNQIIPEECLVFEDAPSGVLAGLNAGMNVIWVHDTNLSLDPDLKQRATAVMPNMEDFVPEKYGLPAYSPC